MSRQVGIGVAGLGVVGGGVIDAIRADGRFILAAGADVRSEALDELGRVVGDHVYDDVAELCEDERVDVVYVCTPDDLHAEHVTLAIRAGKHVVVDKPMAVTNDDARDLARLQTETGRTVICGHTHVFDPPVTGMAELARSGELGPLRMINTWDFNDFLYRPRVAQELDRTRGGSITYNLGPHQIDIVRRIAGTKVVRVRAMVGTWDPRRGTDGSYAAFLTFEDGVVATLVFNGHGHFDSSELHWWVAEHGGLRARATHKTIHQRFASLGDDEEQLKSSMRYGGGADVGWGQYLEVEPGDREDDRSLPGARPPWSPADGEQRHQHFFGLTIVSCERGDVRQSPAGLFVYEPTGRREVELPAPRGDRQLELDAVYHAVVDGRPCFHDAVWGAHTVEICNAMYESAETGREVDIP